jgi:hypothetical protein
MVACVSCHDYYVMHAIGEYIGYEQYYWHIKWYMPYMEKHY